MTHELIEAERVICETETNAQHPAMDKKHPDHASHKIVLDRLKLKVSQTRQVMAARDAMEKLLSEFR